MNNTVIGLWSAGHPGRDNRPRVERVLRSWHAAADTPPLLQDGPLTVFADRAAGLAHGWRGDRFLVCSGRPPTAAGTDPADALDLLADLHRRHGDGFARHADGAFSLLLYDRPAQELHIVQSRTPDTRAYHWASGDWGVCFGNRVGALLAFAPELAGRTSREGFYQLLARTYIVPPTTIYAGVRRIPCGSRLRLPDATLAVFADWTIPDARLADEEEALARFEQLLEESLGRFAARAGRPVYLLSGGYDSSVNVALAARSGSGRPVTIGIGAERYSTDAPYARQVAAHVGADHREFLFDGSEVENLPAYVGTLETPYFEPGMLLTFRALELAAAHGDAVVGGEGTDQVFGSCAAAVHGRIRRSGHLRRLLRRALRAAAHIPATNANVFLSRLENRLVGRDDVNNWCGAMGFRDSDIRRLARRGCWREHAYDSLALADDDPETMLRYACTVLNRDYACYGILPAYALADALGVATFTPYLDKPVLDFILGLDHRLRTPERPGPDGPQFESKHLQKRLATRLLPPGIFARPKQGGAINPYIHLEDGPRLAAIRRRLQRSPGLGELVRPGPVDELFANPRANAVRIFLLLTVDIWHELVVARAGEPPAAAPALHDFLEQ